MKLSLLFLLVAFADGDPTEDWVTVAPPRIGAQVRMPSRPFFKEQKIKPIRDEEELIVRSRSAIDPTGKINYTFVYHDQKKTPSNRTEMNAILDGAVTGAIALVNGELVKQNEIFVKNHKGRDFVYRCEIDDAKLQTSHKLKIRTYIVLVRNRLFSLNYIAEESAYRDVQADAYFKSFELIKTPGDLPPKPRPGRARELAKETTESK